MNDTVGFQSNGRVRVRGEAIHPSCIMAVVHAFGGSGMIRGCENWAGLDPAPLGGINLIS